MSAKFPDQISVPALRSIVRHAGSAATLNNTELLRLAEAATAPRASDCVAWSDREALPLIRELARRLQRATTDPQHRFEQALSSAPDDTESR